MRFLSEKESGFSLAEIIVVLSIIGILGSIIFATVQESRKKGRDAQRMSDLQQLQIASRTYRDSASTSTLPAVPAGEIVGDGVGFDTTIAPYVTGTVSDPFHGRTGYGYYYHSAYSCNGTRVVLIAQTMERPNSGNMVSVCGVGPYGDVASGVTPTVSSYVIILK